MKLRTGCWLALLMTLCLSGMANAAPALGEIAFTSAHDGVYNIYLMNADGSNIHPLTHGAVSSSVPMWSPNGAKLLYISGNDSDNLTLMIMNAAGLNSTKLAEHVMALYRYTFWSPDSQWIIYATVKAQMPEFHRVKADGTHDQALDFGTLGKIDDRVTQVSFFPDGSLLVADTQGNLYTAKADGSQLQLLTNQIGYPAAVAPDGQHLIGSAQGSILETDAQGNHPQTFFPGLTDPLRSDQRVSLVGSLAWSPRSAYVWGALFFQSSGQSGSEQGVFIGTFRGDDYWLHVPTPEGGFISWSSDSKWFAYAFQDAEGHDQIAISQPIGTGVTMLTQQGDNSQPAWRPTFVPSP